MALDAVAFTAFERTAHDSIANRYAKVFTPLTSLAVAPLLDAVRVAMGQRLLDVGTGPGVAAAAARAQGAAVTGVDVSPGMIALARKEHPDIDFQVAEVTELPFRDAAGSVKNLGHYAASGSASWPKRPSSTAALT